MIRNVTSREVKEHMEYSSLGKHLAFDREGPVPTHSEPSKAAAQAALSEYCAALDAVWFAATAPSGAPQEIASTMDEAGLWLVDAMTALLGICALREDGREMIEIAQQRAADLRFDLKVLDQRHWHPRYFKASLARVGADEVCAAWAPLVLC